MPEHCAIRDRTNNYETYGGGRYILDSIKGADLGRDGTGKLILDFNFAYNPSCCYSARYVCPLAPPMNRLSVSVRAGECRQAAELVDSSLHARGRTPDRCLLECHRTAAQDFVTHALQMHG